MQKPWSGQFWMLAALVAVVLSVGMGSAAADTTSSPNYKAVETQFGSGSGLRNCSTTYCAKTSIGDLAVGSAKSDNYSATFGFNTSNTPLLEVITEAGVENLGVLDSEHTATATRIVKVRTHLSNGYTIQVTGMSLTQGTHELAALATPTTSHAGAEQFGVNVAANTAPAVGANPVQVPSSQTSFGYATDDYATPNLFKYINGDIVARSDTSSGQTEYTISIIVNVSNSTAAGNYNGSFSAVVVPLY